MLRLIVVLALASCHASAPTWPEDIVYQDSVTSSPSGEHSQVILRASGKLEQNGQVRDVPDIAARIAWMKRHKKELTTPPTGILQVVPDIGGGCAFRIDDEIVSARIEDPRCQRMQSMVLGSLPND